MMILSRIIILTLITNDNDDDIDAFVKDHHHLVTNDNDDDIVVFVKEP